ncbi:MAG: hypothetical protein HUJ53_07570 [Holdemanella sp.]|nr:hypothetical protein [Holdemanella sp.]
MERIKYLKIMKLASIIITAILAILTVFCTYIIGIGFAIFGIMTMALCYLLCRVVTDSYKHEKTRVS